MDLDNNHKESPMLNLRKQEYKEKRKMVLELIKGVQLKYPNLEKKEPKVINKTPKMKNKKLWLGLLAVILILVVSNPSKNDFANYYKVSTGNEIIKMEKGLSYGRTGYFGIFSTYQYTTRRYTENYGNIYETFKYLAIFKNFIKL